MCNMPKYSHVGIVVFFILINTWTSSLAGNNSGAAFSIWPDTGQTKCYNNTVEIQCPAPGQPFYGQDAQYSGPTRSYTLLVGGTMVQDNVTGLVWEIKDSMDGTADYSNPHDADNTYTWCDPNAATNGGDQGTCGNHDTKDFIDQLNSGGGFGGYTDWRIPTIKELATLANLNSMYPTSDPLIYNNMKFDFYWSSTTPAHVGSILTAYNYDFWGGGVFNFRKGAGAYVRAVRGGQDIPENHFIDNGDGSLTDTATCLQWQKVAMDNDNDGRPDLLNWQQALELVENLNLAGKNDWRLPNINELSSLIKYSRFLAYDPILNIGFSEYWSSTSVGGYNTDSARSVEFGYGATFYMPKSGGLNVRAVRGQHCGGFGPLVLAPSSASFPSLYPGQTFSKTLTVSNPLPISANIVSAAISGTNASDFNMWDSCSGNTLATNGNCNITVNVAPNSCGSKEAVLTVSTSQGNLTANLSGVACGNGLASLSGTIRDAVNFQAINGAAISVGANGPYLTNDFGKFQANDLSSGTYELRVSKQGYDTWIGAITLNPQQAAQKDIKLTAASSTALRVTSVNSKYSNGSPYYFLPGIAFDVTFTASVDWAGKMPGKVRFITSKGSYDVATAGNTAPITLNIGTECNSCSTLAAIAIAADGSQSAPKSADFMVTGPLPVDPELPILTNNLAIVSSNSRFSYKNNSTLSKNLLEQTIGDYDGIPILNKSATALSYVPEFDFEFSGEDGKASYVLSLMKNSEYATIKEVDYSQRKKEHGLKNLQESVKHLMQQGSVDRRQFPSALIAGFELSFFPTLQGDYIFNSANCGGASSGWSPMTGYAGLAGKGEWSAVYQSLLPPPLPPIPYYISPALGLEFDAMLNINDASNLKFSGDMSTSPYLSGTLGAGVNDVVALEGTGKGGADVTWNFPVAAGQNAITDCSAYFEITGRAYVGPFGHQFPTARWETQVCSGNGTAKIGAQKLLSSDSQVGSTFSLISREYLQAADPTGFQQKPTYLKKSFITPEKAYSVFSSPIVSATFPVSAAVLSSAGSHVNLIWLADKPERSSINRTMAVHSAFDGITWSAPIPLADNGTADFNPTSLTFTDGGIMAAWEDVAIPLADTSTLEELLAQLEVSAALYDPIGKSWGPAVRLTNNLTLDRTPKLAGKDKNNLMLTWISNAQNDISGSATHANQLKYALYNGTTWSTPQVAAVIPNQIKRYNVVYDGSTANVVLALDTDNDPSTLEDLELYRLVLSNGAWGTQTRLTNDTIIDDNPQLSLDNNNRVVMTWLRRAELSSVVNFDFVNRTVITKKDAYTSTLADFRQATTTDGRVAVIYADTSENSSSDLFGVFYDPIFKLWGLRKQLTDDSETEQWPSIAFLGADTIISTYNRKLLLNADRTPTEGALSDLYMLKHTLANDLAIDSLTTDIANAAPGMAVTLSAIVQNLGDNTAQNITVSFYNGNPADNGTLIGNVVITDPLKPGESVAVSLPWTIPQGAAPVNVYVVVDPGSTIDTLNRTNNVVSTSLALPDLKIQGFTWEMLEPGHYNLVVSVANIGGTTSGAGELKIHKDYETGSVVTTINLPSLPRFASIDLSFEWYPANVRSQYTLVAVADEGNTILESNEFNNSYQLTLKGEPAIIGDINGDRFVDLKDAIVCLQVLTGMLPDNLNPDASANGEGKIGMAEVIYVIQKVAGLR